MTLDRVKDLQTVKIRRIDGGSELRRRLHQLGIFEGGNVRVKRLSRFGGPLIIEYDQCEVAIGRGMAAQITIEPVEKTKMP